MTGSYFLFASQPNLNQRKYFYFHQTNSMQLGRKSSEFRG